MHLKHFKLYIKMCLLIDKKISVSFYLYDKQNFIFTNSISILAKKNSWCPEEATTLCHVPKKFQAVGTFPLFLYFVKTKCHPLAGTYFNSFIAICRGSVSPSSSTMTGAHILQQTHQKLQLAGASTV